MLTQQQDDDDEDAQWRDLQDAQITAMAHVWDNPEDERWNDIADSLPPAPVGRISPRGNPITHPPPSP